VTGAMGWRENKILLYLALTALMVVTFAGAMLILNTAYGAIGWGVLLVVHLMMLVTILLR
jgi:hypothetical protein